MSTNVVAIAIMKQCCLNSGKAVRLSVCRRISAAVKIDVKMVFVRSHVDVLLKKKGAEEKKS